MHITDKNNEIIVNFSHFIHSFMFWHRFCKLLKKHREKLTVKEVGIFQQF